MTEREEVLLIANASLVGMQAVMTKETSTRVLFNAALTITARFVQVLLASGVEEAAMRESVQRALFPVMAPTSKLMH